MIGIGVLGVASLRRGSRTVVVPDLLVERPGIVLVRGANGTGKSTLVELLAGGIRPREGTVRVCGAPASSSAARRLRRVSRAEIALLPGLTVRRHAALFARAAGVDVGVAVRALDEDGLGPVLDERVAALSTGEARRAWVRLTTLGAAPVLLLDEPFLGIDSDAAAALQERLERWGRDRVVLLVDHGDRELRAVVHEVRLGERSR